jgi:hypothetical protein
METAFQGRWKNQAKIPARLGSYLVLVCLAASIVTGQAARAQAQPGPSQLDAAHPTSSSEPTPFWADRGRWNFGFQLGYAVENAIPRNLSHINLLIAQPQLGFTVRDFRRGPVRRFEILDEGILGDAVHPGGHLLGTSLLFRFDGKPYRRVMPFLDMGAGVLHTTLHTRAPELTGRLQFLPQAGLGIQYFFRPQRALVFEFRYLHMSNAGLEPPNEGFNASMLTIGFRWLRYPQ